MRRVDSLFAQTVVAVQDQVSCDLGGETIILGLKGGMYYGLNPLGTFIWNLIQKPITIGKVRDRILEEYQVEPGQCEQDLVAIMETLLANGLIERTDEKGA
jgi:hypothetical protein